MHESRLYEVTDDAQIDGHIMPLSARVTGQVEKIDVIEGQLVHAGDVVSGQLPTGPMRNKRLCVPTFKWESSQTPRKRGLPDPLSRVLKFSGYR
jgi:hypothetical protein